MSSFDNFVQCQVIAPVAIGATELDLMPAVAPYKLPPVGGGLLVLVDSPGNPSFIEVIRYTARSGQQLTGLTRGQEGTVARAWSGTVFAFQSLMAGDFQSLLDSKLNAATYTAADVLTKIKTVAGAGSGLDADLLDGQSGAYYQSASNLNAGTVPDARLSGTYTGVNITGNAATATALQTARTINGVSFNGTANITVADATKQTSHANLTALSGLTGAADRLPYFTGAGALSLATLTALARDLLDDTTQSGMQSTLGLVKQTSAIDTTAGALMAVGAGGWMGDVPVVPYVVDIDDKTMRGWRYVTNTTVGVKPSTYGHVLTFGNTGDQVCQEFWELSSGSYTHRRWYRQCFGAGAWGLWNELYQTGNILGTVSQSGGVPTGAIMERGSNGNGTYHRYADGTQITLRTIDYPAQALSTQGGINTTHSANFNGEYVVNITPETCIGNGNQSSIGALLYNGIYVAKFASYVDISSYAYRVAVEVPVRLQVMCVGRWY